MVFPFAELPTELALEIIRLAAFPEPQRLYLRCSSYSTVVSLASVSHAVRRAAMPHLLHTVILSTAPQVIAFIHSIRLQHEYQIASSPLALDYPQLVHRFWATECWEPLVEETFDDLLDYGLLYEIISKVQSLGLNFRSLHLLYNGLASAAAQSLQGWNCRRLTLAGAMWRWKPLTSTPEGMAALSHLTHLTLWIPTQDSRPIVAPEGTRVPQWVQHVPFVHLHSLTHLAFPLLTDGPHHMGAGRPPIEMLVYTERHCPFKFDTMFREWSSSNDPLRYGVVIPLGSSGGEDAVWEVAFLQGENDNIWEKANLLRRLKDESEYDGCG